MTATPDRPSAHPTSDGTQPDDARPSRAERRGHGVPHHGADQHRAPAPHPAAAPAPRQWSHRRH